MLVSLKTSLEKMLVIKSDLVYLFWVSVQKIRPNLWNYKSYWFCYKDEN